jgi:hypothetical protein
LIATTALGAKAGFVALWIILLSCFIKVVVQEELGRYTMSSGETTFRAFDRVPGRLGPRFHSTRRDCAGLRFHGDHPGLRRHLAMDALCRAVGGHRRIDQRLAGEPGRYGISRNDIIPLFMTFREMVEAFEQNLIDAAFATEGLNSVIMCKHEVLRQYTAEQFQGDVGLMVFILECCSVATKLQLKMLLYQDQEFSPQG